MYQLYDKFVRQLPSYDQGIIVKLFASSPEFCHHYAHIRICVTGHSKQNSVPVIAGEVARTCKSVCIISRSLASCLLLFRSSSPFIFIFFPCRPVSFSIVPRISVHRTSVPVSSPFFVSVTMSIVSTFSVTSVSLSVRLPWFLSSKLFFSKLSNKESYQNRRIDTLSL